MNVRRAIGLTAAAGASIVLAGIAPAQADKATVTNDDPGKTSITFTKLQVDNAEDTITMKTTVADLPKHGNIAFTFTYPRDGSTGGGVVVVRDPGKEVNGAFFTTSAKGKVKEAKCKAGTATWSTKKNVASVEFPQSCWTKATGKNLPDAWFFSVTHTEGDKYDVLVTANVARG